MILDKLLIFGTDVDNGSKSASAVTEFSSVLQLDAVKDYLGSSVLNDLGKAGDIMLNVRVTSEQLAASSTTAQLDINLHKKSSASSIKSGSVVYTVTIPSIKKAASIASHTKMGAYLVRAKLPKAVFGDTTNKYIGLSTKALTAKISTGKLTAWLGLSDDQIQH